MPDNKIDFYRCEKRFTIALNKFDGWCKTESNKKTILKLLNCRTACLGLE